MVPSYWEHGGQTGNNELPGAVRWSPSRHGRAQGNWIGAVDWQRANAAVALAGAMRSVGITALEQRRLGI